MKNEPRRLEELAANEPYAIVGGPFGSRLTSADYVEDGIPVIRGTNLNGGRYLAETDFVYVTEQKAREDLFGNLAHPGDIVFTQRGTLGQVALIPEDAQFDTYVVSQSQMKMTVDPRKADPRFIYYWFSSRETIERIINQNSSSGVPHINLSVLRNFRILLPELHAQQRIADFLVVYDDLIENNRRRIALLEEAARLLYREWFIHFRFPGHEHVQIVDGLPTGWVRKSLGKVADCRLGKMLDQNKNKGELMPYLANLNVRWGAIDLENLREMRFEDNEFDTFGLKYGDIVMCEGGEPGRCALWKEQRPGMMIQKAIHRIRARPEVSYLFLYHCLRQKGQSGQLAPLFTGATIKHLPREKLSILQVDIPPASLMTLFAEQVDALEKQIAILEGASRHASKARDLLLPRLMNGEIAV